jgi:endonuclease/exonuclease/phosphatase family metal-dependent hydrolase
LTRVTDSSPFLGFFDIFGVGDPGSLEVEVPDFIGTPDFGDIGVWNIKHFNDGISDSRVRDVADVIERLSMDVLGLTEVQRGAMDRLVAELGQRGSAMGFKLLDVPRAQDLAVLFDRNTTNVSVRSDISERHLDKLNARTDSGGTAFPRHPMFAECEIASDNGHDIKFLMIVVHLKAFGDAHSRARRRLASQILAEIMDDVRESEGIPIVLGGDFNEPLDTGVLSAITGSPDLLAMTADDATNDAVSYVGTSYRSLIDHIVVSKDVRLGEIQGDDTAIVRLDRSVADFAGRVSDHVPLVFRMILREESIDMNSRDTKRERQA